MKANNTVITLKRNFSWTLLGNIIFAISQFGILMILAKVGNPKIVGQFTLATAISSPIFLFFYFKLRSVQATDQANEYSFRDYYTLRTAMTGIAMLTLLIIMVITNYQVEVVVIIILIGISKLFDAQSDIVYGLFQKHEEMHLIAKSMIIKGIFSFVLVFLSFYFTGSLIVAVSLMAVTSILVFLFYDVINSRKFVTLFEFRLRINKKILKLLLLSLPLGITVLLGSLNTNLPRYFIEVNNGEYELGIFAGISYLLVAMSTLINSLGQVVTPRLAIYYKENKIKEFYSLVFKLCIGGFFLGLLGLVIIYFFGELILTLIYTEEYSQYNEVFLIITAGAIMLYTTVFLGTALTAMRRFKIQLPIHLFSFITIFISSIFLIPSIGIVGGAIVLLLGNIASTIAYLAFFFYYKYRDSRRLANAIQDN